MKRYAQMIMMSAVMAFGCMAIGAGQGEAATLIWDRNKDHNVIGYNVYVCYEKDCVLNEQTQLKFVNQPTVGDPQCEVNIEGKAGFVGVSTWNSQNMKSPLTIIRFDKTQ